MHIEIRAYCHEVFVMRLIWLKVQQSVWCRCYDGNVRPIGDAIVFQPQYTSLNCQNNGKANLVASGLIFLQAFIQSFFFSSN